MCLVCRHTVGPIAGALARPRQSRDCEARFREADLRRVDTDLSRESARILGRRETDFIFIDMEHSPLNMDALANFVAAINDKAYTIKNGAQPGRR